MNFPRMWEAKAVRRSESNALIEGAPHNINHSGNVESVEEPHSPSSTILYARGVKSMGWSSSSSEATDYGSDDSMDLMNGFQNFVVEKHGEEAQPSTRRGLTNDKLRQCMGIQREGRMHKRSWSDGKSRKIDHGGWIWQGGGVVTQR